MTKPNITPGTVWTGDNLPIMRGMNSESVGLICLDPPISINCNYNAPIGSNGGTDHPDNLQLLCSHCNRSKDGRTTTEMESGGTNLAVFTLPCHRLRSPAINRKSSLHGITHCPTSRRFLAAMFRFCSDERIAPQRRRLLADAAPTS